MYNVLLAPHISCTAKAAKHVSRGWGDKPQAGGQETWLEGDIEMSGSRKEMHGNFCTSASLRGSIIQSRMLVCDSVHLHRCDVAIYTNALSRCSSALKNSACSVALLCHVVSGSAQDAYDF